METVITFVIGGLIGIVITLLVLFCIVNFLLDKTEDK
jgi:hypothetical protein